MAAAVTLSLLVIFCGISEYFRLQIIAVGVRDALEDAIISVVNDNYAGVYHGVRALMVQSNAPLSTIVILTSSTPRRSSVS